MSRIELAATDDGLILTANKGLLAAAIGATAHVYKHGTTTPVTVYAAAEGGSTLSQPLAVNAEGLLPGWVSREQELDVVASFKGITAAPRAFVASFVLISAAVQWAMGPELLITGAVTRGSNGEALSASVIWPDGDTGVYEATTISMVLPGAVDAYTITKIGDVTHTYTQPKITRDSTGAVTNRPAITVS